MDKRIAKVSRMPWRNGDGYSWGGDVVLTIGDISLMLGSKNEDFSFALEMARRWNSFIPAPAPAPAEQEPVAVIGKDYRLLWSDAGSMYEIVAKHRITVGSPLYAHPAPVPAVPDDVAGLVTELRREMTRDEFWTIADGLCHQAADTIEAQAAENARKDQIITNLHKVEEAHRETANREFRRANKAEAEVALWKAKRADSERVAIGLTLELEHMFEELTRKDAAMEIVRQKGIRIEREANACQDVGASLEAKIRIKICDEIVALAQPVDDNHGEDRT